MEDPTPNLISKLMEFLDTVQEGKSADELLEVSAALPSLEEQVVYATGLLKNFLPSQTSLSNGKNSDKVETFFLHAKCAMETANFDFALNNLNKGLALVPTENSDLFFRAYFLRSEILMRARQFHDCAADAIRALNLTDDPDLIEQLKQRLELCTHYLGYSDLKPTEIEAGDSESVQVLKKMKLEEYGGQMWSVQVANPLVPCASDAIALVEKGQGRHFVAAREIKPGEILMVEEPLVSSIDIKQMDHCRFCMRRSFALLPCDFCSWDMYCSEQCKENDRSVHSIESKLKPTLLESGIEEFIPENLLNLLLSHEITKINGPNLVNQLGVTKALNSTDLDSLFLLNPSFASDCKKLLPVFFVAWAKTLGLEEKLSEQEFTRLVSAGVHILPYVANATFSVENLVLKGGYLGEDTFGGIGTALYPIKALVALSCSPNAISFNVERKSVLQATRLIAPGSLVTQCLHPRSDFLRMSLDLRLSFLQETTFFRPGQKCQCEACVHDWPTLDKLQSCPADDLEAAVLTQTKLTLDLLPLALRKAEEMECRNLQHTKQFHQLQERIRMSLASQGNVRRTKAESPLTRFFGLFD